MSSKWTWERAANGWRVACVCGASLTFQGARRNARKAFSRAHSCAILPIEERRSFNAQAERFTAPNGLHSSSVAHIGKESHAPIAWAFDATVIGLKVVKARIHRKGPDAGQPIIRKDGQVSARKVPMAVTWDYETPRKPQALTMKAYDLRMVSSAAWNPNASAPTLIQTGATGPDRDKERLPLATPRDILPNGDRA
jgi:hypothetical protein